MKTEPTKKCIRQFQKGNKEAFDEIFAYYQEQIYFFALSIVKNTSDAEEVVQETFIKVLNHIKQLKNIDAFNAWIFRIAYTNSYEVFRKNKNIVNLNDAMDVENMMDEKEGPIDELMRKEILDAINEELEKMPEKFILVAQLKYFNNLKTKEIAEILDIKEGTVKNRLYHVREVLRPQLEKRGYTPSDMFAPSYSLFIFQAFELLSGDIAMSSTTITTMHNALTLTMNKVIKKQKRIQRALSISAVTVAIVGSLWIYNNVGADTKIENISYYHQLTNENIEVEVQATNNIKEETTSITVNKEEVPYTYTNKTLSFVVTSNGIYIVTIDNQEVPITIDNIDKDFPILTNMEYQNNTLSLTLEDITSKIDYTKSYMMYNNTSYPIPVDGKVTGDFKGFIYIYLYDIAGNIKEYTVEIKEQIVS
jgi:RNA polymerase sigma-70 factor (ECF subfamily)